MIATMEEHIATVLEFGFRAVVVCCRALAPYSLIHDI
jgi:hypothetical protein